MLYAALAAICVTALMFRLAYALADRPESFLYWRSETACDLLMAGCVISVMSAHDAGRAALQRFTTTKALAIVTAIFIAGEFISGRGKPGMAVAQCAVAVWLAALIANILLNPDLQAIRRFLNHPLVAWFGRISYSLYLWHFLVGAIGPRFLPENIVGVSLAVALSIALAAASYHCIEQPILRRRKFWASRLGIGAAQSARVQAAE